MQIKRILQQALLIAALVGYGTVPVHALESDFGSIWSKDAEYGIPEANPIGFWFGDFNRDYYQDILIHHNGYGKLSLFLSKADGSYNNAITLWTPKHLQRIWEAVVADFDKDGWLDFAVTHSDGQPPHEANSNEISVYLNTGSGNHFNNYAGVYANGLFPNHGDYNYHLDAGDIDRDGDNDIVVSSAGDGFFAVLENNGDGTFIPVSSEDFYTNTPLNHAFDIKLADINADNKLDVVLVGSRLPGTLHTFLGNGNSLNHPNGSFDVGSSYISDPDRGLLNIFIADLKKDDHQPDILMSASSWRTHVTYGTYVLHNTGNSFSTQPFLDDYIIRQVWDWNCDGHLDVIASHAPLPRPLQQNQYAIFINDGSGNLTQDNRLLIKNDPYQSNSPLNKDRYDQLVDLDGDGKFEFLRILPAQQKLEIHSHNYECECVCL